MPFLIGEVGGISKHVPTVQKEGRARSGEQQLFGVTHLNFFSYHGSRRFDSLFRFSGENDVCDTSPFMAARLPLGLTSVTPSLRRNKGSLCPRHEVRMVPLFRAMRDCLWIFQRLG